MKYRDKLKIIADILRVTGNGSRKTRIMYLANLSHALLKKYLKKIINAGLISSDDGGFYTVTEKGRVFLKKFNDFSVKDSRLRREFKKLSFEKEILENMCQ